MKKQHLGSRFDNFLQTERLLETATATATIASKDAENAASKASFRQLPNRTHRNRPASFGWLVR